MSRIVFLAMGSLGDVRPHLSLARSLHDDGREVLVMAMDEFAGLAAEAGVPFAPLGVGIESATFLRHRRIARAMATNELAAFAGVRAWSRTYAAQMAAAVDAAVRPGDLLLSGVMAADVATALVRARDCRAVNVTFCATSPSTDGRSTVTSLVPDRPSLVNRLTKDRLYAAGVSLSLAPGTALRRRLGLRAHSVAEAGREAASLPTLVATTSLLAPRAQDWPLHTYVTGPWIEPADDWVPPHDLGAFVDGAVGEARPVVYVGFGSSVSPDPVADIDLVAEAARRADIRVVYRASPYLDLVDPTGTRRSRLADGDVFLVRDAPHEWLFPRMSAVVHHGGAGTTVAGLRAGVPSAVVSHAFDQPYHLRRLREIGVGPGGSPRGRLTADRLAVLLRDLTTGVAADTYRTRAKEAAVVVRAEDGVGGARQVLTHLGLLAPADRGPASEPLIGG